MAVERDKNGRFLKGHSESSPGRPPRQVEQTYLQTMQSCVSVEDWQRITERAVADATSSNTFNASARNSAREWLSKYLLPPIEQIFKVSGVEGQPAVLLREIVIERTA